MRRSSIIDLTQLLKNGIVFTDNSKFVLKDVVNILPFIDKSYRSYNTFREYFNDTFAEITKAIYTNTYELFFRTVDGNVYYGNTVVADNVIDINSFGKWFCMLTNDNKLLLTQDFTDITTIDISTIINDFVATNITKDQFRLILYNKYDGVMWFSGFNDPTNWVENQPDETLNAFYHDLRDEIVNLHQVFNDLLIITKFNIYRKKGDYPYEFQPLLKGDKRIVGSIDINNDVYLFYDNTFATLKQAVEYGDFKHVDYLDANINGYSNITGQFAHVTKFYRGLLINSKLYYDIPTKTFFKFDIGKHLVGDLWQLKDGKIYTFEKNPTIASKTLQSRLSTNVLYFTRGIVRRIIGNVVGYNSDSYISINNRAIIPLNISNFDDIVGYDFDIVGIDADPLVSSMGLEFDNWTRVYVNRNFSITLEINGALLINYIKLFYEYN